MDSFSELQSMAKEWRDHNFPIKDVHYSANPEDGYRQAEDLHTAQQVMGVCEEAGELAHAVLKMQQAIRGDGEKHLNDAADAIGDIIIYLTGVCDDLGLSLHTCVADAWDEVAKRDWIKDPLGGVADPLDDDPDGYKADVARAEAEGYEWS